MTRHGLTGLILAGGSSSRMGRPKPLVVLGGQLILARVKSALERACDEIVLVVAQGQDDATPDTGLALGMHVVADRIPGAGPLAGLDAGLRATHSPLAFVVAADHPFVSSSVVSSMAALARSEGVDAVVPSLDDRLEPLHAVYAPHAWLSPVSGALDEGRRSIYGVVERAVESGDPRVKLLRDEEYRALDPGGKSLFDVDTPESLETARSMLGSRGVVRPDIRPGGL